MSKRDIKVLLWQPQATPCLKSLAQMTMKVHKHLLLFQMDSLHHHVNYFMTSFFVKTRRREEAQQSSLWHLKNPILWAKENAARFIILNIKIRPNSSGTLEFNRIYSSINSCELACKGDFQLTNTGINSLLK